ncbi:MAG TPA: TA system VapC family ribonuclease toxin [Thermoanaerobaculia bacterium]
MIAVDTNILVHAHRSELPEHENALRWLTYLAQGSSPWGIPVFCLGEFLRVVTHTKILKPPSSLEESLLALEGLLEAPTLQVLSPGPRYPELLAEVVRSADARGNLVFDAQIAALCREQGIARVLTLDRDFDRFPGIEKVSLKIEPGDELLG